MTPEQEAAKAQVAQAAMIRKIDAEMERLRPLFPNWSARGLRELAADSLDAEKSPPS